MIPRSSAAPAANSYSASVSSLRRWARPRPTIPSASSSEMFSSCPVFAFVAGVKMGSGRRSDSARSFGSRIPQTVPAARYSFQPDPAR